MSSPMRTVVCRSMFGMHPDDAFVARSIHEYLISSIHIHDYSTPGLFIFMTTKGSGYSYSRIWCYHDYSIHPIHPEPWHMCGFEQKKEWTFDDIPVAVRT